MSDIITGAGAHTPAPSSAETLKIYRGSQHGFRRYREVYLLLIPGLLYFAIFWFVPAVGNVLFALIDFHPLKGFFGSDWVGLKHFKRLFSVPDLPIMLRNTFVISGNTGLP